MHAETTSPDYAAIRDELIALIAANRLVLPGIPEAAQQVRQAATDPQPSLAEIAAIAERDPTLAAHLIKVSNMVAFRRGEEIHSLRNAVTRLGARLTAVTATSFAILQMVTMSPRHVARLRALYRDGVAIGERSYLLAQRFPHLVPEDALLAGLVHSIGTPVVLQYVRSRPKLQAPAVLEALIREIQASVGAELLRSWHFPLHIVEAVAAHEDWYRGSPVGRADYADLLIAAKLDLSRDSKHTFVTSPVPALARLGLSSDGLLLPSNNAVTPGIADVRGLCGLGKDG